jgi:hypothetical protein
MHPIDRRDFLGYFAATLALPTIQSINHERRRPAGTRMVVTHCRHLEEVMDQSGDGMDMGVEEARRSAEMFGGSVTSRILAFGGSPTAGQPEPPPRAIDAVPDAIQIVIPGVLGKGLWRHTIRTARAAGAIVFNVNARTTEPYETCETHVFHVRPSPATLGGAGAPAPQDAHVELWSPTLVRFGADSLNKRFQARRGELMDSPAWAAWFAVKCAWEGALASRATTASQLIAHLERVTTRVDGHKGQPLSFNANHELVQPLYLVESGSVRAEIDPAAVKSGAPRCG